MTRGRMKRHLHDDDGMGVITVILVMAVMSALVITATALTVNNVGNSRRDRQALSAIATSEAGVAQAIQHVRGGNLASLGCRPELRSFAQLFPISPFSRGANPQKPR